MSKTTLAKINDVITTHEYFKNSYFWQGNNNSSRLNFEKSYKIKSNNNIYIITQACNSTRKNVYYSLKILVNGIKKDIRVLKKLIA